MCNKVAYDTKDAAKKEAKQIKYTGSRKNKVGHNNKDRTPYPYMCHVCKLWHLTTLAKNVSRRITKHQKRLAQ